ncbi:MAG: DUF2911 domain-containing protein [Bacteroidetes bacterium]|nr:MAG: DUF2911 domain-containing protein [Bacteroidota bacterium]
MKKKVFIGIGIFVILLVAAVAYLNNRNRTLSPPGKINFKNDDISVVVNYSRPSVRGRLIFGTKEDGALQPYGEYWRLGANEGTEIIFDRDVSIEGNILSAGTYRFYGYPYADYFEMVVSKATDEWGYSEPDTESDLFRVDLPVDRNSDPVEQYTIEVLDGDSVLFIYFDFSDYRIELTAEPKSE